MCFIKPNLLILIICFALTACAQDSPQLVETPVPVTTVSEATAVPPTPTATATPLPSPAAVSLETAVTFEAADGVTLPGMLYGDGDTAVIFSHMGEHHQNTWAQMAQTAAEHGYLALTYDMRFWRENGTVDATLRDKAAEDLLAAIAYVRAQGAQNVVLVGASLGGLAALEVADETEPTAVIILASPFNADFFPSLRVTAEDVQTITAPILFIASEEEDFTPGIEQMYDLAAEPKEIHIYPGAAHGTDLFQTEHAADLRERILAFIQTYTAEAGD